MATKKAPIKKKPTTKAASTKKLAPKKALAKAVAKKVPAKKRVAKAAKKKHPLARLLEIHKKGSITKKGLIISIALVVVAVLGYGGYTIYQNMSADAGGKNSLRRGWTSVGSVSFYVDDYQYIKVGAQFSACKVLVGGSGYQVKGKVKVTSIKAVNGAQPGDMKFSIAYNPSTTPVTVHPRVGTEVVSPISAIQHGSTVSLQVGDRFVGVKNATISSLARCSN